MTETREEIAARMSRGVPHLPGSRSGGRNAGWLVFALGLSLGVLVGYFGGAWYDNWRVDYQAERSLQIMREAERTIERAGH